MMSGLGLGLLPVRAGGATASAGSAVPPAADEALPEEDGPARPKSLGAVPGQVLVRFRDGVGAARQAAILSQGEVKAKMVGRFGRRSVGLQRAAETSVVAPLLDHLALLQMDSAAEARAAIAAFKRQPEVLYAEPNYRLRICPSSNPGTWPNDFEFPRMWALHNEGQTEGLPGADLHMPEAWSIGTGSLRVTVAVIDTGIDYFHPDLEVNVRTQPGEVPGSGIDEDGNGYIDDVHGYDFVNDDSDPMDDQGHGTHVSGIIGAVGNNKIGVAGVCWRVSLMALKAFDENGDAELADVLEAIHYARANGAQIINASWEQTEKSQSLQEAIQEAHRAGVLIVAAAGNDRTDVPTYPAAYEEVITVAATTAQDQRAEFSNYGPQIDVAAPGDNIYSAFPNAGYGYSSGTSMAAPHVAGVAALVLARHPEFTNLEVETILRNAVDAIRTDKWISLGRLNAWKALQVQAPLPEARLSLSQVVSGRINIQGTAAGQRFAGFTLAYGQDFSTTNWTEFQTATTPVTNGNLFISFDTARLEEGPGAIRLTVRDDLGQSATAGALVTVRNVHIASPMNNDMLRAGDPIPIRGTVSGPGRAYTIEHGLGWQPAAWSTEGITLVHGGTEEVIDGVLAIWDTRLARTNEFYALRLTARVDGKAVGEWKTQLVYLDAQLRPGFPVYVPMGTEYATNDWRDITVADLDGDTLQELIRVDPGNSDGKLARLLVYEQDGRLRWSKELAGGEPYSDIPVVGDVDGDGLLEIFTDVGDQHELFAFRHDGTPCGSNWPVRLEAANLGKTLADLDGDGKLELIGYAQDPIQLGGIDHRQLVVLDSTGALRRKWNLGSCANLTDTPKMLAAAGNLDEDSDLEIAAVFDCNQLAMFDLNHPEGPVWTTQTDGALLASPVIGDLLHNGQNEIVIGLYDTSSRAQGGTHGGVCVFSRDGQPRPGWPVLIDESFAASPALADFDGDGTLEIAIPSWTSHKLHVLRTDGFEVSGWPLGPFNRTRIRSSPLIGDVNGDGRLDLVIAALGQLGPTATGGDFSTVGGVSAWSDKGQLIDLNPNPNLIALLMESSGGSRLKCFPLTLTDLDRNGKLDLVAATIEDRAYLPEGGATRKNRYSIYAWELAAPYQAAHMAWPAFQRNAQHTGYFEPPQHTNQPPVVLAIPNQTVKSGRVFFPIELDRYIDDPDNAPAEILWSAEGAGPLQVRISPEHVATVLPPDPNWAGQDTLRFVARDPGGLRAQQAVVFAARPDYEPPAATDDQATTPADTPVEIDVLANDHSARGQPLTLIAVSRPWAGTVEITPRGTLLYTPAQYFNGADSLSYTVSDGQDNMARVTIQVSPVDHPSVAVVDRAITDEDIPLTLDVLANDKDPDGDRLSLVAFSQPQNGTVTETVDSKLLYTPKTNYFGIDSFTYQITDGHGAVSGATAAVMVKPVNDPPVVGDQSFTLNRNTQQEVIFQAADADGDELSFKIVQGPEHGELWNYPKLATFYPNKGYAGPDRFSYQASDGDSESQIATVQLIVLDVNNAPKPAAQTVRTKVGQPLPITLSASDPDGDPISFRIVKLPSHGLLGGNHTDYTYTPVPEFIGQDTFTFQAGDGQTNSAETTVSITVTDQNTAPVASDSTVNLRMNIATNVLLQATDAEGNPLTFLILTNPANGSLSGDPPRLLYTPMAGFIGPDRFNFKASDGQLESRVATVTLNVLQPNLPPETQDQSVRLPSGGPARLTLQVTDPEGDPVRCAILKGPRHGRLNGLGTNFTYTAKPGFTGSDSFTFKAWDGQAYSKVATVVIDVSEPVEEIQPFFETIHRLVGGSLSLTLKAQPGRRLAIQASADLINWSTLIILTPSASTTTFVDTNTPGLAVRFYRLHQE